MKTAKTIKSLLSGTLALTLLLTGCSNKENSTSDNSQSTTSQGTSSGQTTSGSGLQSYGQTVSVAEIKSVYGSTENNGIMPLYNVEPNEAFEFRFRANWYDEDTDVMPSELVTVHTDPACTEKSRLYTANMFDEDDGTMLTVAPIGGVLTTDSEENGAIENGNEVWGNASMYYIAIWYDTEADGYVKLNTPVVIPFTVKHELPIPTIKGVVDTTGRFKLTWEPVEGATSYNIYRFGNTEINYTGEINDPVAGADSAFDVGGDCFLIKDSSIEETEFDNFAGKDHGLAIHYHNELDEDDTDYIIGQNYSVCGSYFVTAVFGDEESGLSNIVNTADLILPHKIIEDQDPMFKTFESEADLPQTVSVINIDGSVTERRVFYKFHWGTTLTGTDYPRYRYTVEGTAITGECSMDISDGRIDNYTDKEEGDAPTGFVDNSADTSSKAEPDNETAFNPDSSVPTIIESNPDASESDGEQTLVDRQIENTDEHIQSGDKETVGQTEFTVFAESAEEEWLARNLIAGNEKISLEAFPSMQQYETLADVFQKVYYQNPYVLGVTSYKYDYGTLTLKVNYCYNKDEIAEKQSKILSAANEIIKENISADMSDEDKCRAIYDYFNANTVYDNDAVSEAEKNNFIKGDGWKDSEDAFNAYGIIVEQKGVCQSYALSYKLLCSMSGVDSRVITGYLNGNLPHAWNSVNLDGKWYQTDCTNNATNCGIPFFLYEAGEDDLAMTGYTEDKLYDLDTAVGRFSVADSEREYYTTNGLCASSVEEFKAVLSGCLADAGEVIVIKFMGSEFPQDEIIKAVIEVYNMKGMENKLAKLGFGYMGGYILLIDK